MLAARYGHGEVVSLLLARNASVAAGATSRTPLMEAARNGHAQVARLLLEHGAAADAVDQSGQTALTQARQAQATDVVALLESSLLVWLSEHKLPRRH